MKLYRITIEADVYADEDWDSIKNKLLIAYKTADGEIVAERPGKYEAIKIINVSNDEKK
tara:strand:+ start:335 stop:511 length:177 start_codon:yes stop_codon:yes gene_type:complete